MSFTGSSVSSVKALMDKRKALEDELVALQDVLKSHHTDMNEELVDQEGYPRADIDIHTVRNTRVQIIYLQNDLKALMSEIEEGLHLIHAEARDGKLHLQSPVPKDLEPGLEPFLKVDAVTEDSPAWKAGLQVDDLILRFGSVTISNFTGLQVIGSLVNHSEGKELSLTIRRDGSISSLKLVPQKWSGRGLLGCNVVPVK